MKTPEEYANDAQGDAGWTKERWTEIRDLFAACQQEALTTRTDPNPLPTGLQSVRTTCLSTHGGDGWAPGSYRDPDGVIHCGACEEKFVVAPGEPLNKEIQK